MCAAALEIAKTALAVLFTLTERLMLSAPTVRPWKVKLGCCRARLPLMANEDDMVRLPTSVPPPRSLGKVTVALVTVRPLLLSTIESTCSATPA